MSTHERGPRLSPRPASPGAFARAGLVLIGLASGCAETDSEEELQSQQLLLEEDDSGVVAVDAGPTTPPGNDSGIVFPPFPDGGIIFPPFPDASFPMDAGPSADSGPVGPFPVDGGPIFPGDGGPIFPPDGSVPVVPFANYLFDDCSSTNTLLRDSSPSQAHALRSASVTCANGIDGLAVRIDGRRDMISAQIPTVALKERVAVAAWISPASTAQGTIVTKQAGVEPFSLALRNGQLVFTINLDNGRRVRQVVSRAPIQSGVWSHVAALYDGQFVRLLINGTEVGVVAAQGSIVDTTSPLLIGNNLTNNFLNATVDDLWLSVSPVTVSQLAAMSCKQAAPTFVATPQSAGPVPVNTTVRYDVAVTNNDRGACAARQFFFSAVGGNPGVNVNTVGASFGQALPGQALTFNFNVTASEDAEPGTITIPFNVVHFPFSFSSGSVQYILQEPTGCFVRSKRELMITDLSVVEDPIRTTFDGPANDPRTGVFTFAHLMEQMAPTPAEAPDMVERMFRTWLTDQDINGFTVPARPAMQQLVLDGWPRTADGKLDLKRAPMRLLAIVNRIDSRNLEQGHAGEGRFVFAVVGPNDFLREFTMILEYRLPARSADDVINWADKWHALGALPFPSERYNAALQEITQLFTARGAEPGRVNGNTLAQLRTNEIDLGGIWELREFELSPITNMLEPSTTKLTPDDSFNGSSLVADFINQNEEAILREQHVVPSEFGGVAFLGGGAINFPSFWDAPGIRNPEARHKFSLNTCAGCHSSQETGTGFLHVFPRSQGQEASLSSFVTGGTFFDPITRNPRELNDLRRRNVDLTRLVCEEPVATTSTARTRTAAPSTTDSARAAFVAKGIGRVH